MPETPDSDGQRGDTDDSRPGTSGASGGSDATPGDGGGDEDPPLPDPVVDEAERLTRLARDAVVDEEAAAYREDRDGLLAEHDYVARVREDDARDVLVCHPAEWVEDGTVRTDRIEDIDRGVEVVLSGPGMAEDWAAIDEQNRDLVEDVREAHGDTHAANAAALADFMGNHYAKPIERATRAELREFLEEYYPRNAWPTAEQRAVVEKSVRLTFETADETCPLE